MVSESGEVVGRDGDGGVALLEAEAEPTLVVVLEIGDWLSLGYCESVS